ncbi:DUF2336 domain-containing protein [Devosia rhodophyticola]|uniref:DUF2336 domain-containing protein n=1 Tax=Devosia rhodophyticola TaxID=3026423 RepID=A0ABY7YVU1_9HYPH|nr:DUF2336 domain-containing protein [Devosia rhodophyticola]WDR05317.1 DUF2336 domain-containing protein [Devosia rhodophyticola]
MSEIVEGEKAFSSFRVLNGDADSGERDQLFRNMAQLFAYVSDRCDDDQVAQYDEVLCHLAELVEVEARVHVAKLLAPLERAPGTVVVNLANDTFEVARPLLEFSSVLSDDDLIDIIGNRTEAHRTIIAGRDKVPPRVGDAIVDHGGTASVACLVRNAAAELGHQTLEKLLVRATKDAEIATDLRGRPEIDWSSLHGKIRVAADKVIDNLAEVDGNIDQAAASKVNAVVYNRLRNRAGFSAAEWKVAYNQVKALSDRRQLDQKAMLRFVRFGYGHHAAAALTVTLRVGPEVLIKWLAMQDYVAITVALKALGLPPDLFEGLVSVLPWRDLPDAAELQMINARYEALSVDEASGIFELWRAHAFRKRQVSEERATA